MKLVAESIQELSMRKLCCVSSLEDLLIARTFKLKTGLGRTEEIKEVLWIPPMRNWHKINTDRCALGNPAELHSAVRGIQEALRMGLTDTGSNERVETRKADPLINSQKNICSRFRVGDIKESRVAKLVSREHSNDTSATTNEAANYDIAAAATVTLLLNINVGPPIWTVDTTICQQVGLLETTALLGFEPKSMLMLNWRFVSAMLRIAPNHIF
ncbi:hypothetical protein NE237_013460 [Protea cynaroides]|uniref:Uncharacterized protein n=1 Tax=Protea cynaroides TaxID=273540 RepID=A0A9Q0GYN5_9MAGN|nr:hypothetical protein NE237_013460 [Protea cynaroides]